MLQLVVVLVVDSMVHPMRLVSLAILGAAVRDWSQVFPRGVWIVDEKLFLSANDM
jgi:hypothetical protein